MKQTIGVFDSGVGGRTTAAEIQKLLPDAKVIYYGDSENCPYGEKTPKALLRITSRIVQNLQKQGARMIVIACNTATTQCIRALRIRFPDLTFVGTEPAIKLACDLGCNNILLMATPGTIQSKQVKRLLDTNITNQEVTLLPCAGLAELIEHSIDNFGNIDNCGNYAKTQEKLRQILQPLIENGCNFDGIVLGCTHYIYLKMEIQKYFPQAKIIDGNTGVAKRCRELMK